MPVLESQVRVNAPLSHVYAIAKKVEDFPSFMQDVDSLTVVERDDIGSRTVTDWVGLIPEFKQKIRWTEEDIWDDAAHTCRFRQLKGDYKTYEGEWRFTEEGGQTLFSSTIDYDIEIPLIGALIKNLVAKKMRDNTQQVLDAIKMRAEG